MFTKYFKFYLYSILAVVGSLVAIACFGLFGSSTLAKTLSIVSIALGSVILFEALVIYFKIMKILYKVVDNITLGQVIASIVSSVCMFAGVCFLGYNTTVFFLLLPLGIIIRLVFKVHQVNRILPFLCADLDEEIKSFNEESEEGCSCGGDCSCGVEHGDGCGCGGDHGDGCGCGGDHGDGCGCGGEHGDGCSCGGDHNCGK